MEKKYLDLILSLALLRYKQGDPWYETTDYLRDCLKRDGYEIQYIDSERTVRAIKGTKMIDFNMNELDKLIYKDEN